MFSSYLIKLNQVRERLQKMGPFQPINIFLRQEIDRMQRIIVLVRNTLTDLRLAIDGTIIMSENLRDALDCMYDARIPARWKKVGWESHSIQNYKLQFELIVNLILTDSVSNTDPWIFNFYLKYYFNSKTRHNLTPLKDNSDHCL